MKGEAEGEVTWGSITNARGGKVSALRERESAGFWFGTSELMIAAVAIDDGDGDGDLQFLLLLVLYLCLYLSLLLNTPLEAFGCD